MADDQIPTRPAHCTCAENVVFVPQSTRAELDAWIATHRCCSPAVFEARLVEGRIELGADVDPSGRIVVVVLDGLALRDGDELRDVVDAARETTRVLHERKATRVYWAFRISGPSTGAP